MIKMYNILAAVGLVIFYGAGTILLVFYVLSMFHWLGILGVIIALLTCCADAIFPFIYWIVEKQFPVFYFILWGIGWAGLIMTNICITKTKESK